MLATSILLASTPTQKISAEESLSQTGVTQALLGLLSKQDNTKISPDDYESTSLKEIVTFATPAGYRIKLRYLDFGMALVESLKIEKDPDIRKRLIEMVQWSRDPKVRAEAIITLASLYNPAHKKYFKEAILDSKIGIRFAAVEALELWNQEGAIDLLKMSMGRDWSPFMQVFSAQALLSMGDQSGLPVLWKGIEHNSWVVRAMAARYLGDYANADDYAKIVDYLNKEDRNDYVAAEMCIAALKLISKKGEKVYYSPTSKGWQDNEEVKYTMGKDHVIEVEPLVIVPPRLRIPASLQVAAQINTRLIHLLKDRMNVQLDPIQAQDPVLQDLYAYATPTGFALATRYSSLSYLLVEALAGSPDLQIQSELRTQVQTNSNPLVRATALVALSYNKDQSDLSLIQDMLRDKNALSRMGAMEAADIGHFEAAWPTISNIANNDPCSALQVYAMQLLSKYGDVSGRNLLLSRTSDLDWPARAMSYWYLGRYGTTDDYTFVLSRLPNEQNPFVQAEITLALLRLSPLE